MPQNVQMTQGVILRVIPFQDNDQILTLFTSESGIIKVIYKGWQSKKRGFKGSFIPLTQVELAYLEKRGEIFNCQEMVIVDSFFSLRKQLLYLEVACDLLHSIYTSQMVGKAAPQLYALLCYCLKKIPHTLNPWILAVSFRLKLLKHDGLVIFPFRCSECGLYLQTTAYTLGSEGWCEKHQPACCIFWEKSELQQIYRLAACLKYQEMQNEEMNFELKNKIDNFFEACVKT